MIKICHSSFLSRCESMPSALRVMSSLPYIEHQSKLPRLPIPDLSSTVEKYLRSIKPLVASPDEYRQTQMIAEQFLKGPGKRLQELLVDYGKTQKYSWLKNIWLQKAYLEYRLPLIPHSNWWMYFQNPLRETLQEDSTSVSFLSSFEFLNNLQLLRAASLIHSAAQYKQMVDKYAGILLNPHSLFSEKIAPEFTSKGKPLCMNQYLDMFGATRIPKKGNLDDVYTCRDSKHVIILADHQMFRADIIDKSGTQLSFEQILCLLHSLKSIVDESKTSPSWSTLTALHRNDWADMQNELARNPNNLESFANIENALFFVCLDRTVPSTANEAARNIFLSTKNRWYGKSLSFIIFANGEAGLNGEHSPADALVPSKLVDHIILNEHKSIPFFKKILEIIPQSNDTPQLKKIDIKMPTDLENNLSLIEFELEKWYSWLPLTIVDYQSYGTSLIKEANISPDSYVQACLIASYYFMHQSFPVTYETASTRRYLHGRTDAIRVLSVEATDFVKSFKTESSIQTASKFLNFVQSHSDYTNMASKGHGIDRHLLGLRAMLKPEDEIPDFFNPSKNPIYFRSISFDLSTSNMSPGYSVHGMGFGPVKPDGFGINYILNGSRLLFSISAWEKAKLTNGKEDYAMQYCPRFDIHGNLKSADDFKNPFIYVAKENPSLTGDHLGVYCFRKYLLNTIQEMKGLLPLVKELNLRNKSKL